MRVFKNRAEAEAAGFIIGHDGTVARTDDGHGFTSVGRLATDLEAQLAEALEAVEWNGPRHVCPDCLVPKVNGQHASHCKISLALRAFRGEGS